MMKRLLTTIAVVAVFANLPACQNEAEPESVVLQKAQAAMDRGRFQDALDAVRELVARNPESARLQRIYGEALIATGQPSLAVWPLTRAMHDPEEAVIAGIMLTGAQLDGGSEFDAIETASRVIGLAPENHRPYMQRARAYLVLNMEEKALADVDRAVELGFEDDIVDFVRIYALFGLGLIAEGEALLDEVNERAISDAESGPARAAELCAATAQFAYEKHDLDLAAERFEACLEEQGMRNVTLVSRAIRFYDETGQYARGSDITRRRFEENTDNIVARVAYTERLVSMGDVDEAERLLLEATAEQGAAWSALVDLYVAREDFGRALEALERALEANPNPPDAWFLSRADFLIILGRVDEAEVALADIQLEPHRGVIEGRLLVARGELEAAAKRFEETLVLWTHNPNLRYLTANAYERLGEWKRAASHFREAARQDPPHYLSSLALADIMQGLGDREGRLFVLLRLTETYPRNLDVLEDLLDLSRELGNEEYVRMLFLRLSRSQGAQGRAVANVARASRRKDGLERGIQIIDSAGVNLARPLMFPALELRAEYLAESGRSNEAIAQLDAFLGAEEPPPHPGFLQALRGKLLLGIGQVEEAEAAFRHALEFAPAHLDASIGLARAVAARGDEAMARSLHLAAIEIQDNRKRHEAEASMEHAEFEITVGKLEDAKQLLRAILLEQPRHGAAALRLAQLLHAETSEAPYPPELIDAARRALLFEQSPEAAELTTLFPEGPPGAEQSVPDAGGARS